MIAPVFLVLTTNFGDKSMRMNFTWGKSQMVVLSALTIRGWSVTPNGLASRCTFLV